MISGLSFQMRVFHFLLAVITITPCTSLDINSAEFLNISRLLNFPCLRILARVVATLRMHIFLVCRQPFYDRYGVVMMWCWCMTNIDYITFPRDENKCVRTKKGVESRVSKPLLRGPGPSEGLPSEGREVARLDNDRMTYLGAPHHQILRLRWSISR